MSARTRFGGGRGKIFRMICLLNYRLLIIPEKKMGKEVNVFINVDPQNLLSMFRLSS